MFLFFKALSIFLGSAIILFLAIGAVYENIFCRKRRDKKDE